MEAILSEIESALRAGLYYLALAIALSLPDVCAALESSDGTTSGPQYKAWYDRGMAPQYPRVTSTDMYSLRCGVIHQGRFGHDNLQYSRILFTLPNPQRNVFHNSVVNDALNLDACIFCRDIMANVSRWYDAQKNSATVRANLPRLLRLYPHGLAPYMVGISLIS
jgi:hypothetical protein